MSKLKLRALVAVAAALVAFAAAGAGWKSGRDGRAGYAPERVAGWTWDAGVVAQPQGVGQAAPGDENGGD